MYAFYKTNFIVCHFKMLALTYGIQVIFLVISRSLSGFIKRLLFLFHETCLSLAFKDRTLNVLLVFDQRVNDGIKVKLPMKWCQ